jgi:hypothetical protein
MKHYRISFDFDAEDPTHAVMYLLSIGEDPGLADTKFDWIVKDLDTGEERKLSLSARELEPLILDTHETGRGSRILIAIAPDFVRHPLFVPAGESHDHVIALDPSVHYLAAAVARDHGFLSSTW